MQKSTAASEQDMQTWPHHASKQFPSRIYPSWKKNNTDQDLKDRQAAKKTIQANNTPQSTQKTPLPRRPARIMRGALKPLAAKGISLPSDSGALTQSAVPRSYSLSNMYSTPDAIPER
jgi:hypothetical protein